MLNYNKIMTSYTVHKGRVSEPRDREPRDYYYRLVNETDNREIYSAPDFDTLLSKLTSQIKFGDNLKN